MGRGNEAAKAAKIAVWWDMKECPIPEGYDARRVRPSVEGAFKKLGYSGPVSITAYGDQKQAPGHLLRGLSSTGVAVAHTRSESTCSLMYSDMLEWRSHNPPPATMMIISNQVEDLFSWDLARLQQRTQYNIFLAYSFKRCTLSVLDTCAKWLWEELLGSTDNNPFVQETGELFYCKSCNFDCPSLENFRKHLSSYKHAREEAINPTYKQVHCVTKTWGRNYTATPEHATAKIQVWWDMFDCPIPEGYDARRVRPSMEAAFKKLGYSGPVSITAYGDQKHTPDHLLRAFSSTGIDVAHTIFDVTYKRMSSDMMKWEKHNPGPATMMLITDPDQGLEAFSLPLAHTLQEGKYKLFLAYSFRPYKMPALLTSAEWLWESLLAVSETTSHFLEKCSESAGMFYCKLCFCDCKSLDNFRTHLSSKEHALHENGITTIVQHNRLNNKLGRLAEAKYEYKQKHWREIIKSKRMRKAFRMGFRPLHNQLRLTNRRGARRSFLKSQTCKK